MSQKLIALLFLFLFAAFVFIYAPARNILGIGKVETKKRKLLCDTNYQVLLQACRDLSNRFEIGELEPRQYAVSVDTDPKVSTFSAIILNLEPSYVWIYDDGRIMVALIGGMTHCGIEAYPEIYEEPFPNIKYGDKELIPGLWYYDDGYEGNPNYYKKINKLIRKNKYRDEY
ncbi:MAG: hypothetical protein JW787_08140 [Sedimentisphaerales bacterium]|nr:hypothetical protein [Sedimentisphaerales bacterium]